jgi:hypothetical protein
MMTLDQALADFEVPPPDPGGWAGQLADVARQMRTVIRRDRRRCNDRQTVTAFGDDTTAVLFYYPHTANVSDAPAAECLTVTDGKITGSVLVFDRSSFAPPQR